MATIADAVAATDEVLARPAGLSSPPDSNHVDKSEPSDSELSDLEEMEEDIGVVEPDHFADDGHVPVFKPTMDQFKNFKTYMNKINEYGMRSGIVKVIPPSEWLEKLPRLDESVKRIRVREPIRQEIMGTSGTYRQTNLLHGRSYNLAQWRQLCEQSEHQPPAKRGERRAVERPTRAPTRIKAETPTGTSSSPRRNTRSSRKQSRADEVSKDATSDEVRSGSERLPTPESPSIKAEDETNVKLELDDEDTLIRDEPRLGSRQGKVISTSARRKYNRKEAAARIEEESFKGFQYEMDTSEFTQERCEELERTYWKTLTYAPPLYGADMPGSLFDENITSWNLGRLPNLLDVLGTKIPGVNTAYLYLGMWKATFAWHLEDVDLYSINFLHFGAPKQWYSISQGDARRFEAAMKTIWPADAKACDQFLRHKTFLISPSQLLNTYNIRVNKIVHHPGEFMITYPYGYHSGYNLGYNCAEAVNFALDSWLDYGRIAKRCDCSQAQDSVWIDVGEIERKLRGEETEYEDSEDDIDNHPSNLPTPPESGDFRLKVSNRRRLAKDGRGSDKKLRVRLRAPPREPCALCPNDIPSEQLLPTDDGRQAHRMCALYIPETYIEVSGSTEIVKGISLVKKARLDLRCMFCRSRKGACFQCSQKMCTRAYHATCAAAAGVFVEEGEIPIFAEDGTEYKDEAVEFSCRFHRVRREKHVDAEALDDDASIKTAARALVSGSVCQMQYLKGDIFAGAVVENRQNEETLLVDILPRGDRVEVEYKWLVVPDASDYRLPKPSDKAIPFPSRKAKEALVNGQVDTDVPQPEDEFVPGFRWGEFEAFDMPKNPAQVNVDFAKQDQMWYYLGEISTEYRSHYTEDPKNKRHNPKSNFLDSIPKPTFTTRPRQSFGVSSHPNGKHLHSANTARYSPLAMQRPLNPAGYSPAQLQPYKSQQPWLQLAAATGSVRLNHAHPTGFVSAHPSTYQNGAAQHMQSSSAHASANAIRPGSEWKHRVSNGVGPFAKYPYLQKQHNKSAAGHRSPYRTGGGFMNGYQGSLRDHLIKTGGWMTARIGPQTFNGTKALPANDSPQMAASHNAGYSHRLPVAQQPFPRQVTKPTSVLLDKKDPQAFPSPHQASHATDPIFEQFQSAALLSLGGLPTASARQPSDTSIQSKTLGTVSSPHGISRFPDVPPDSSTVVEQLMANLRRATANRA